MRKIVFLVAGLIILIIAVEVVHSLILGGSKVVSLGSSESIAGVVAQSLEPTGGNIAIPQDAKDFNLTNVNYFYNNTWAVANISPTKGSSISSGLVVLHNSTGIYQVVIGPGTAFDNSILITLPSEVGKYLNQRGYIYEYVYQ